MEDDPGGLVGELVSADGVGAVSRVGGGRLAKQAAVPIVAIIPGNQPTDIESLARHGVVTMVLPAVGHFLCCKTPPDSTQLLDNVIEDYLTR